MHILIIFRNKRNYLKIQTKKKLRTYIREQRGPHNVHIFQYFW